MPPTSEELVVMLDSLEQRLCSMLASGASVNEIWDAVLGEVKCLKSLAALEADIELIDTRVYDMLVRNYMVPSNDFQTW